MAEHKDDVALAGKLCSSIKDLKKEIGKVIVGQDAIVDQLLLTLLCKGHCLLVGVPGLAKTLLIKTVSSVLDLGFNRIQFTPDLMPSDITGTEIIEEDPVTKRREFRFIKGPLFSNVILADEINRTPPKTQAALLEAMQERRVTVAGKVYTLNEPFFVLATQNPIEQEGTYPLPEAQLDRFMFNLLLTYPSVDEEKEIVRSTTGDYTPTPEHKLNSSDIIQFQELVKRTPVSESIIDFIVRFVNATRPGNPESPAFIKELVRWGAGPRASQFLTLAAKAHALMNGRYTPSREDVEKALIPTLRHRIIINFNAESEGITSSDIIQRLLREV